MAYPATLDSFSNPQGTTLLSNDHALEHRNVGTSIIAVETVVGTTAGTNVLKNFVAGDFPSRINASNILQQVTTGTVNLSAGTITGQIVNSGTVANGVYGTATYQGGTGNSMTLGTPIINHFTSSGTTIPVIADRALAPIVGTLADSAGGTITANSPSQQIVEINLGTTAGNRTLGTPANPVDGIFLGYRVKQNTNNTGTLVWASVFRFNSSGIQVMGTQSTWNYYGWRYNTTDVKWDFQGNSSGII